MRNWDGITMYMVELADGGDPVSVHGGMEPGDLVSIIRQDYVDGEMITTGRTSVIVRIIDEQLLR